MIVPLRDAQPETCGAKASTLGALARAGFAVPDGFAIPFGVYRDFVRDLPSEPSALRRAIEAAPLSARLLEGLSRGIEQLEATSVAVRSSASGEDGADASAAGQHESVLAVQGVNGVANAVRACWASLHSPRALAYRSQSADDDQTAEPEMAVLVQRHVDADASGVLFTPGTPDGPIEIECSWGLGQSVVGGTITPDAYRVAADGTVTATIADKDTRVDRQGTGLVSSQVPAGDRNRPSLTDGMVQRLAVLGRNVADVLGGSQDIEFAIEGDRVWVVQARPVTVAPPMGTLTDLVEAQATFIGTPGSQGVATGSARIVRGPADFARVSPGDILICPHTDPAWTPLLRIAGGVVTEMGGVLSHAAIVARERGIPAVLAVRDATTSIQDGTIITIDGSTGTVITND